MKKNFNIKQLVAGIVIGALCSVTTAVVANQWIVSQNTYTIKVNNSTKDIQALNINDRTYLQLKDLSDAIGLGLEVEGKTIYITNQGTVTTTNDYSSVPDFAAMSGLKADKTERSGSYNRIEHEYKTKNGKALQDQYIKLLENDGFTKVYGIDDDLKFDDDDNDDDIVYKKGNIYVSIDYDSDDIEIIMATKIS